MKRYLRKRYVKCLAFVLTLLVLLGTQNTAATAFDGCGTLMAGYSCPILFAADSGGIFFLDNYGGFIIGKYVHVVGSGDTALRRVIWRAGGSETTR